MDLNTLIPVVVSNLITALVATLAWRQSKATLIESRRQHDTSLRQDRALHDLGSVRQLLNECALRLRRVSYDSITISPRSPQSIKKFQGAAEGLDELGARLEIWFGSDHDLVTDFREAEGHAYEVLWKAQAASRDDKAIERSSARQSFEMSEKIEGHRKSFVELAQRWAGAQLAEPGH